MQNVDILYVEDEPDYQTLVQGTLERAGFLTQVAGTGQEGLLMLERRKPRLLILDLNLPDMDGYSICKRIRQNRAWADLAVLMVTVRYRAEDWLRGFSSGADDYLAKPINPPELLERVHFCLTSPRTKPQRGNCSEYHLIEAVRAGNRAAFGALCERYRNPLVHKMISLVASPEEAEDIVSDAFVKALENLAGFRGQASFFTWIYRIALNGVNLRHQKTIPISLEALKLTQVERMPPKCVEPDLLSQAIVEEARPSMLQKAISELPLRYRQILGFRIKRLPYQSIASLLRIPVGTVKSRVFKAKRLLIERYNK